MAISIGRLRKEDNRRIKTREKAEENVRGKEYRKRLKRAKLKDKLAGYSGVFSLGPEATKVTQEMGKAKREQRKHRLQKKLDDITPILSDEEEIPQQSRPKNKRRKPKYWRNGARPMPLPRRPKNKRRKPRNFGDRARPMPLPRRGKTSERKKFMDYRKALRG